MDHFQNLQRPHRRHLTDRPVRLWFVFGPDEAALDLEFPTGAKRDEDAAAGDFFSTEYAGPVIEPVQFAAQFLRLLLGSSEYSLAAAYSASSLSYSARVAS
ncbi:Hypothetical protein NGAL_HAMBI2610_20130 [Neorhizobium galegae bv. orientalis]|nr:Hypothetical protein NGAL_HAMBI2610_20130 [Neorhizobium galegae bv. orientalis]